MGFFAVSYARVNKCKSLLSAYCLLSACFFQGLDNKRRLSVVVPVNFLLRLLKHLVNFVLDWAA